MAVKKVKKGAKVAKKTAKKPVKKVVVKKKITVKAKPKKLVPVKKNNRKTVAIKKASTAKTAPAKPAKPVVEKASAKPSAHTASAGAHHPAPHKGSSKHKPAVVKSRQVLSPAVLAERRAERLQRSNQTFAYMKAPGRDQAFDVGDIVEVFCDHEKNRERIRGWVRGIVVQVDHKMVAVQFRSNVFLTDGWMVPDRILWYPVTSDQIRSTETKKAVKNIPDY